MKQLTQQLKSGRMRILEVPLPALNNGQVLVRNCYSVISAGTEGKTVADARKGYIAKARSRQKEVQQALKMIKTIGLKSTYEIIMNKLEAESPLGYSCAGEVIAVGTGVSRFKVGDRVACGGSTANHSEAVCVPENLCAPVPEGVDLRHAAFTALAAIAIQGLRQADLRFGESCLIIGLGLLGQLTALISEAVGIRVIGVDIDPSQVESAKARGIKHAFLRSQEGLEMLIRSLTGGHGTDAVLITAATSSNDPIEFAGVAARKKGKVVMVGSAPTGFSRELYYKKELELRMSCSYGPGRYDVEYEEKGRDYPIGWVRWTENRNMQAFLDLLAAKKVNVEQLISHEFPFENVIQAYDLILSKAEPYTGILVRYEKEAALDAPIVLAQAPAQPTLPQVGFIGAGNFAQNMLLPRLKGLCEFIGITTAQGYQSRDVADKYGFTTCYANADELLQDKRINTVFIVTRHHTHADFVIKALSSGKHVFVEKPLAINLEELEEVRRTFESLGMEHKLMVGFNRRFAPAVQELFKIFAEVQKKAILIRINAGLLPGDHWTVDPEIGGGRIVGEACHFIDLAMALAGSPIKSVSAEVMDEGRHDSAVIHLAFADGSIASVYYLTIGNSGLSKEYIEVHSNGISAAIDDFKELTIWRARKRVLRFKRKDKGHGEELRRFIESIKQGAECPIPFREIYCSMKATLLTLESLRSGRKIWLDEATFWKE